MENIWVSIPNFKNQSTTNTSNIESYFIKLYEDKEASLYATYKDNIAEKMLNDYGSHLDDLKKLYCGRSNYLITSFKQDLDNGKNKCVIKIILYGPDDHYTNEEESILNMALNNFCSNLTSKNYPHSVKEEKEMKNDFMDGMCTIGYKIIEITLK